MAKKDGSLHDSESTLPGQLSVNALIFHQVRTGTNLPVCRIGRYFRVVWRSGSSVVFSAKASRSKLTCIIVEIEVWYLGDVWEVYGWKTNFWQCSVANSPTSCLEQFFCSSDWQLAPLLPFVRGAAHASLSGWEYGARCTEPDCCVVHRLSLRLCR